MSIAPAPRPLAASVRLRAGAALVGVLSLVASCSSGGSGSEAEGDATPSTTAPTYFARIVVDGVAILVKAVDGYDGTSRFPVDADQMAPLAQEMVARVQER